MTLKIYPVLIVIKKDCGMLTTLTQGDLKIMTEPFVGFAKSHLK
jgi:hypothetical protein